MTGYLEETALLDYSAQSILDLFAARGWDGLSGKERILAIYNFVRDEIRFGYNVDDAIKSSRVLSDGFGQCNTKGILIDVVAQKSGHTMPFPRLYDR